MGCFGGKPSNENEIKDKSLTALVCHHDYRCCRSQSFWIKYLDGNQILCVRLQVMNLVVLGEKGKIKEKRKKIMIMKEVISTIHVPVASQFFSSPFMLSGYK